MRFLSLVRVCIDRPSAWAKIGNINVTIGDDDALPAAQPSHSRVAFIRQALRKSILF
jgi:hypothetical protein